MSSEIRDANASQCTDGLKGAWYGVGLIQIYEVVGAFKQRKRALAFVLTDPVDYSNRLFGIPVNGCESDLSDGLPTLA